MAADVFYAGKAYYSSVPTIYHVPAAQGSFAVQWTASMREQRQTAAEETVEGMIASISPADAMM